MSKITWPAWFNSPDGKRSEIFNEESDVPAGWTSGAEKITVAGMQEPAPKAKPAAAPTATPVTPDTETVEVDAHGWPWSADLHAASKGKTGAGLWRMKVGARRPAPKPGYPIAAQEPAPLDL